MPVRKSLHSADGRRFLIEAVAYSEVQVELDALPASALPEAASATGTRRGALASRVQARRVFPAGPSAESSRGAIQLAAARSNERGLVLDFAALNSTANAMLKGDTTSSNSLSRMVFPLTH